MGRHPRRLVDGEQRIVLVNNRDFQLPRRQRRVAQQIRRPDEGKPIATIQAITLSHDSAIE